MLEKDPADPTRFLVRKIFKAGDSRWSYCYEETTFDPAKGTAHSKVHWLGYVDLKESVD
jgi:hypothetical protein